MSTLNTSVDLHRFIAVIAGMAAMLTFAPETSAQPASTSAYTANHPLARESKLKAVDPATGLPVTETSHLPADSPLSKILPDVSFDGLPMEEIAKILREKSGANILLGTGVDQVVSPPHFVLHNVSVAEVLATIADLTEPHLIVSFGDGKIAIVKRVPRPDRAEDADGRIVTRVFSLRGIVVRDPRDVKKPSGFTQEDRDQKAAIDEVEFRNFVEKQLVEAIDTAFKGQLAARDRAGLPRGPESELPHISSHIPTRLVIVSGDYRAVDVAAQVIDAMIGANPPGAKSRTAPNPIIQQH